MRNKVLIPLVVGLVVVSICCGGGTYLFVRNTVSTYKEISSKGLQVVELLNKNAYASVVEMIDPASRVNFSEPVIRERWEVFTRAIGGTRSWGVQDFNLQSFGNLQQANVRTWVRGAKGEGRIEIEFRRQGDKWWITDLKWVW